MIRIIKRYESRKLYDTEESRYVSLEDIAKWVRDGQEVKVIDNATSADVSAQILTQIILDDGKRGTSFLPTELLHELVRAGEKAVSTGVERVQGKVDLEAVMAIPRHALRQGNTLWVVRDDHLSIRAVEVARRDRDQVLIKSGVEVGELVVTSSLDVVTEGMIVRVSGEASDG